MCTAIFVFTLHAYTIYTPLRTGFQLHNHVAVMYAQPAIPLLDFIHVGKSLVLGMINI